jgi:hypothetical protein
MSLLPKKTTPQEWLDVPLPLDGLDLPGPKPVREVSKKDKADAAGVRWVRYKGRRTGCDECLILVRAGEANSVGDVTYVRSHGENKQYLCGRHTADQRDSDNLGRG